MNYEDRQRVKVTRDQAVRARVGLAPAENFKPKPYHRDQYQEKRRQKLAEKGLREENGRVICNLCGKSSGKYRPNRTRHEEDCVHS